MNAPIAISPVRKTVRVKAPIARAFDVFTSGLSRWWPLDHSIGKKPVQKVLMEPRLGGRGSRYQQTEQKPASPRSPCGSRRIAW
jgi:hypothetical protein